MITRSIRILAQPFLKRSNNVKALQQVRHSSEMTYRSICPESPRWTYIVGDGLNAFMWWWIFVHCYYQWGHVVGHYDVPDPEKWTDAELGITDEV